MGEHPFSGTDSLPWVQLLSPIWSFLMVNWTSLELGLDPSVKPPLVHAKLQTPKTQVKFAYASS